MKSPPDKTAAAIAVALVLGTLALYWPVLRCDFINYDDDVYVTANTAIQQGLTARSVAWAFTTGDAGNWHPLTWLSHALDVTLYGLKPEGHHLTSLLLHAANALLLFLLLRRLTGATWRSGAVAALFAWHPLHVESVAWVAERKDVLSAFFFLLTLWAYATAVTGQRRQVTRSDGEELSQITNHESRITNQASAVTRHASPWYWLALLFFALGLMAKPMLVTLPFVLLLLDFWPLKRVTSRGLTDWL